jgi:hypothetical protein
MSERFRKLSPRSRKVSMSWVVMIFLYLSGMRLFYWEDNYFSSTEFCGWQLPALREVIL